MATRRDITLRKVENDHTITRNTDIAFWYNLQNSLLLALREQGRISMMQYRYASERLKQQQKYHTKKLLCEEVL